MPVSKNRRKKTKKSANFSTGSEAALPDRKSMEKMMAELTKGIIPPHLLGNDPFDDGDDDPLWKAQNIIYDAWESGTKRTRIALAREALEVSDLCADAYVLLAEEAAKNIIEKRDYYEQAVATGEKALGPEAFIEDVGHFWGILETRPYMRARCGLANCLWDLGERGDAAKHLLDMLRLNPNDNQGVRYILMAWLLALDNLEGLEKILKDYPEDSAWATYSQALLMFKLNGPSTSAAKELKAAVKTNPHVANFLLRAKRMPKTTPEYYSPGSKEEAVLYLNNNRENWSTTNGALKWLGETM